MLKIKQCSVLQTGAPPHWTKWKTGNLQNSYITKIIIWKFNSKVQTKQRSELVQQNAVKSAGREVLHKHFPHGYWKQSDEKDQSWDSENPERSHEYHNYSESLYFYPALINRKRTSYYM